MKIIEIRALRGPNYYSRHTVIFMRLDIEELEMKPTDLVPDFKDNISYMMPTLYEHRCSPGRIGGFFERLITGTWAGHVVEHVALELQCLVGHEVGFGKTFTTDKEGIYNLVYRYIDEETGIMAGKMSVEIVDELFRGKVSDIKVYLDKLNSVKDSNVLGPSTKSIVDEASAKGIPYIRLNEDSYVQLGYGINQRRIQATMMDNTSSIGVEIADDKARTKSLLSSMGIPVPKGYCADTYSEALEIANSIGFPVVVKPSSGNHGRGITTNIKQPKALLAAFNKAQEICNTVIVEKFINGFDYRILVIDNKFVAAALREPAFVTGNGINTIEELIEEINKDPQRGNGHEKNLTKIIIDSSTERLLNIQNLSLNSTLNKGEKVYVKSTANLSSGGIAKDVTETVNPINKLLAERISKIIGLNVIGIDFIAESLEIPLIQQDAGVIEVNAAPGFRMHLNPTTGKPINVASYVVEMLFPKEVSHSIPIIAVTGTNGKTTTTRLISHILSVAGYKVGSSSTDNVTINNVQILKGDYSGPEGALKILMDPTVDHAVLEVARGGILRRGLGYKESDIGILLNISSDHLGEGGINTLEELVRLKSTVTEAVKESGYAVFNADDLLVLSCVEKTIASPILFSKHLNNIALKANRDKGNINVVLDSSRIVVQREGKSITIAKVSEIPITFKGKAKFNIENVLAAVAATFALGIDENNIKKALISFNPSIDQSPGRMNIIDMDYFKVLIDYGHNIGAITATGDFIKGLTTGRKIRMASGVGNRRREDIIEFGQALSGYYDTVVICDSDPRQREKGETSLLVKLGLLKGGFKEDMINIVLDEREAVKRALDMAMKDDLVVLQADDINQVIQDVFSYKDKIKALNIVEQRIQDAFDDKVITLKTVQL